MCHVQTRPRVRNISFLVGEDTAFDAKWLQSATEQNLEYQIEMNRLTGRNETQPDIAGTDGKNKIEEGYSWTQTEEELEIVVPLPKDTISKDINVNFNPQTIKLNYQKEPKVLIKLFHRIDVDSGTWTLEKGADKNKVVISIEKAEGTVLNSI